MGKERPIRDWCAPPWIWRPPMRTRAPSIGRPRNCAGSPRAPAPTSRRVIISMRSGAALSGASTTRACRPSRRSTILTVCSSYTTVWGAKTGARMASRGWRKLSGECRLMYEHRRQRPLPQAEFLVRLLRHFALAALLLVGSRGLGMGPVNNPVTPAGKLFAGCYSLYAGLVFIVSATLILAPVLHRMLHLFH